MEAYFWHSIDCKGTETVTEITKRWRVSIVHAIKHAYKEIKHTCFWIFFWGGRALLTYANGWMEWRVNNIEHQRQSFFWSTSNIGPRAELILPVQNKQSIISQTIFAKHGEVDTQAAKDLNFPRLFYTSNIFQYPLLYFGLTRKRMIKCEIILEKLRWCIWVDFFFMCGRSIMSLCT